MDGANLPMATILPDDATSQASLPMATILPDEPAKPAETASLPMATILPDDAPPVPAVPTAPAAAAVPPVPPAPMPSLSGIFTPPVPMPTLPDATPPPAAMPTIDVTPTPAYPAMTPGPTSGPPPDQVTRDQFPGAWGGRILEAAKQGWQNTGDVLTPVAQAWADKYGLGGDARVITMGAKALGAAFSGGIQAVYESAVGMGLSEPAARDLTAMAENAGMTGGPHIPGPVPGYGRLANDLRGEAMRTIVTPDRTYQPPPREPLPLPSPDAASRPEPPVETPAPSPPAAEPETTPPSPPEAVAASTQTPAMTSAPPVEPATAPARPPIVAAPAPAPPGPPSSAQTGLPPSSVPQPSVEPANAPPTVPQTVPPAPQAEPQTVPPVQPVQSAPQAEPPVPPAPQTEPPPLAPSPETPQPVTPPPDDRPDITTGGSPPATGVGEAGAPGVLAPGEPGPVGGQGNQGDGAGDHQGTQAATPVQPAAAAPDVTPAKRPVTTDEYAALSTAATDAQKALGKAERNPNSSPEQLDKLRQRLDAAREAFSQAERPPVKGTYLRPGMGPTDSEHAAAVEAHQAKVDARIHAEGEAPVPAPQDAGKIFAMADQKVIRGTDSAGNNWVGTGHALVRGNTMEKAAARTAKLKTSTEQTVQPNMIDKVVTPTAKVDYQPVTFGRRVTADGLDKVVGTRPDGTYLAVQKPVYDALHAAAGPGGTVVTGPGGKRGGDERLFARNAQGETTGVGMPMRVDQTRAKIWMHGAQPPTPGKLADVAPGAAAPAEENLQPGDAVSGLGQQDLLDPTAAHNQPTGPAAGPGDELPGAAGGAPTQLDRLIATRDQVAKTAGDWPQRGLRGRRELAIRLEAIEKQIRRLQAKAPKAPPVTQDTGAPVTQDTGAPVTQDTGSPLQLTRSTYQQKDIHYYKFNNGTSVYRSVFEAAGHDPNLAVNRPLAWQNRVLSQHLRNQFGFRDVTVAPGTNPMFARDTMLDLARAGQDMANALGMRASLVSLDGRLAFSIEPRGKREYLGAYDGGSKTIHLVNDANSFGHEWIHAVDHLLTEQLLQNPQHQNLLSRHTRAGELDTSDGTQAAFAKLINTMFYDAGAEALQRINLEQQATQVNRGGGPTRAAIEAQRHLDALNKGASQQHIQPSQFRSMAAQFGKPSYWASAHEMLARAGEAWIARQMENNGVDPRGVVMPDEAYLQNVDRRLRMTFPKDDERTAIFAAYHDLFDRLRNDGIITGPTAPKADFPAATLGWSRQTPQSVQRTSFGQAVRRELVGLSAGLRKLTSPIKELTGGELRPAAPSGLSIKTRAADKARVFLYSYGAIMRVIIARHPGPGGRALQAIHDKLTPSPGSGRVVGETFAEEHRAMDNVLRNRMGRIFEDNGISNPNDMSALEGAMIHHVMTTGRDIYPNDPSDLTANAPGERIPANLVRIAGELQNKILNPLYRELSNAGFEVGVAPNGYFPRMYDTHAVYSDPQGFTAAATNLHRVMFDKDVGPPGDDPVKLLERWTKLTKAERAAANNPDLVAAMKELRKNLLAQETTRKALAASPNDATLQAKLDQLEDEARQLAEDNHELVRDHVADLAASDWVHRILEGDPLEFETLGPSGRFLNRRELPPEADQMMREFMHTDPRVALPRYFDSVSRRLTWARTFGKDDAFLKAQIRKATDAGVPGPDLQQFQSLVNQATGRMTYKNDRHFSQVSQQTHAMGAVLLMSRSVWSSLAEPVNAAMATGELGAAWHTFANQFGAAFRKASAAERAEIADMLGVTTSSAYDSIMQSRTGAEYADSPATDRFMSMFYRATFLTQLTTSQRRAAVGTADWLLRKWAKDLQSTDTGAGAEARRDDATRQFNELGISAEGNNLRDQFANWVLSHDGPVPASELATNEFRGVYGRAIRRLVDRMVQNPYKIDRPMLSGVPVVSLAYQLMSFNYSYQKNILEPMLHSFGHAWRRGYQRSYDQAKAGGAGDFGAKARGAAGGAGGFSRQAAFRFGPIVAATLLTSLLVTLLRQAVFAPDQWAQHEKDDDLGGWLTGLAFSRSGLGGTLDPVGQVFNNLKWNADTSSLFMGAAPGYILKNLQDLIQPLISDAESPNSNTQYYNQMRALYNLALVPAEVIGLTLMNASGGPWGQAVTGGAMQYLTSPAMANKFAGFLAGPKGSTAPTAAADSDPAGAGVPGLEGEMPDGKPSQPGGAPPSNTPTIPLGMLDDIAAPLVKVLEKPWQVMPAAAKMSTVAILGALYGLHWWQETARFRDNPNQPVEP